MQFTPPAVRGGNILYYWQWAYLGRENGRRRDVLRTEHMTPWLEEFPALEELTIDRGSVPLLADRAFATRHHFGSSFTAAENLRFSRWLLHGSRSFMSRVHSAQSRFTAQTCVINVRRGDYYSVPAHRVEFGMDIRSHVAEALEILDALGRSGDDFVIVSDDPDWCATNLRDLLPGRPSFVHDRRGLFDDLAVLAASRTLILANSTFSYWGSHLAAALNEDHIAVAPPFHQRTDSGALVTDPFDHRWRRTSLEAGAGGPA